MKAIVNGKVLIGEKWEQIAVIFAETIVAVVPEKELANYELTAIIDAKGHYVAPGFIDIHIHGCNGRDTMDEDDTALAAMSLDLASTGVTAFLPTTMTMSLARINDTLARIRKHINLVPGAQILGCHLEGPFINSKYKGAQAAEHILNPNFSLFANAADIIKIVTFAPEMQGSYEFIKRCSEQGIVMSLGHSNASYEEAYRAFAWGVSHLTHTFNAMPPMHQRLPGPIGAAIECKKVSCELIADNIHVHPAMQRLLLNLKGLDKIILITDAMRAALLGDGRYDLGGQMVTVQKGKAKLDDGTIAGSTLRLNEGVRNFVQNTGVELAKVLSTVTLNPARMLGLEQAKGSIAIGKDADLVIFDNSINIVATFVRGKKVYGRE